MSLYTVSSNPAFAEIVNAAMKAQTRGCLSSAAAVAELLTPYKPKSRFVIVDLRTIDDAPRFIDFVKSSGPISDTLVIAVGTERDFSLLDQRTYEALSGIMYLPFNAIELALIISSLEVNRDPDNLP